MLIKIMRLNHLRGDSMLIACLSIILLLVLWEGLVRAWDVPIWLLPKPSDFLSRLLRDGALITAHAMATSLTMLSGFFIGIVVAVPLALVITFNATLRRGLYPLIVFFNIMPKTVIGPILIIWLGINPFVAVLIVFLMCFFPILVDAMTGFNHIDPRLFYISKTMGASLWQNFWKFRLPAAMPMIVSGMKIGLMKAVEGVIVAEFIASNKGLGFLIMQASSVLDLPLMFAAFIATALMALIFNGGMSLIGTLFLPWMRTHH